ncbi:hypothetical protein ABWK22_02545 [Gottfriedia acidiceleris]|uniref:hypothetical protein n=1 Tax=Gottfriedia acidiceleris TaxID=371036 RepID=UPI00339707BB
MTINYNFSLGSDFPVWQWLPFHQQGPSYHGTEIEYDGQRYIYTVIQSGSTSTTASTTQLWRFDTWGHGWQYLASLTSGNRGMTLAYSKSLNVLIIAHGGALNSWQIFNLDTTAKSICGVTCNSWTATTMTPVLPANADYGANFITIKPDLIPDVLESGALTAGSTTTTLVDTNSSSLFCDQMIGQQIEITSGTYSGQKRIISSVTDANTLVVSSAFGGAPAAGSTYEIRLPEGTTDSATASTLVDAETPWVTNQYSNSDVVIVSGTGAGQRRRIASNTATTLTLAAAQTGNANTGNWTTIPDATSVYTIQPSSDFLYYNPGTTSSAFYKIDIATGSTAPAWTTLASSPAAFGGGGNIMWPDAVGGFNLLAMRGSGTATFYQYNIGLNTWSTLTTRAGSETFNTGASSTIWDGQRKLIIQKDGSTRLYVLNLATRELEPLSTMPYASPSTYDGKRAKFVKAKDGSEWLYMLRSGSTEFFRVPLEWGLR